MDDIPWEVWFITTCILAVIFFAGFIYMSIDIFRDWRDRRR